MPQHSALTLKRWSSFSPAQQILMIANEMNRAKRLFSPPDKEGLKLCYERTLYLTDLTIQSNHRRGFRKELLRWRDLAAEEYLSLSRDNGMSKPDINRHLKIFKSLLLFSPESTKQIPYLI
jgi:hypothetical protein